VWRGVLCCVYARVVNVEYKFPANFPNVAKDLVQRLLVRDDRVWLVVSDARACEALCC